MIDVNCIHICCIHNAHVYCEPSLVDKFKYYCHYHLQSIKLLVASHVTLISCRRNHHVNTMITSKQSVEVDISMELTAQKEKGDRIFPSEL